MPHGKCSKTQNTRGDRESAFAAFVISQFTCLVFDLKKNKQHFHDQRMTTAEGTRADGPLKQYVWLTLHIHITTRSLHTCIRNVWRPANDDFSLFRHELQHLPEEILDLLTLL